MSNNYSGKSGEIARKDIQYWFYLYVFILQSLKKPLQVQGWITKLLTQQRWSHVLSSLGSCFQGCQSLTYLGVISVLTPVESSRFFSSVSLYFTCRRQSTNVNIWAVLCLHNDSLTDVVSRALIDILIITKHKNISSFNCTFSYSKRNVVLLWTRGGKVCFVSSWMLPLF